MRPSVARITKVAALSAKDWLVLVEVMATLAVVQLGLRVVGFRRLLTWAHGEVQTQQVQMQHVRTYQQCSREQVERIAWLVGVASRFTPSRCLARALTCSREH